MREITLRCICGICDERSQVITVEDDATEEDIIEELTQWVLEQVDHWYEEGNTEDE